MRRYGVLIALCVLFFPFESAAKPEVSPEKLRLRQLKQSGNVVVEDASQTPVNIHLRAIFEAEEIKNTKLRYGEKRTNKIEIEPTLRLDMTVFQGKPLSFFGEMEFIQKKKRQTGGSTNNTDTLNFNQGGLQLNGLVIPGSTVRLGRWLLRDERRWLFDEDIDGVYARFGDKWLTEVGAGRVNYWQRNLLDSSTRGDNNNLMTLLSQYEVSKRGRLGGYVVWQHDRSAAKNDRQLNLGVRSWSSQRGALSHWLEVGTVRGRQDDQSLRGYAVDGGATFRLLKVPLQPRFTLGYAWGSGDSDDDDGVSKRYRQTGLQGNEATLGGLAKYNIYGAALDPELTNIHILTAGAGINVGKEVSLDLIYHYYRQDHLAALVEDTTELTAKYDRMTTKKLGSALDVVIGWRPYSQVRLEARAGWFAPSSRFHSGSSHRSARSSSASSWWMKAEIRF
ncbi:alginate export family protein [Erwinia endophytica]|uniref:alginate export family protein n=1 Tax=Erwinia endophytica TaxID=1563158 RepID=UPI00186B6D73|nr:alginate export family protein [Erwinia endophytica]